MARHPTGSPPHHRASTRTGAARAHADTVNAGRRARAVGAVVLSLSGFFLHSCGSDQALTFTSAEPPEPASVRLFLNGGDVTSHVPINSGFPQEIEVRLHAANGARISGYDDHFTISMSIVPPELATSSEVESRPLVKLLTPTGPPDEPGSIHVVVTHVHTTFSRTFGPFDMLVH